MRGLDFSFSVNELEDALTPRTRLVILNSPHNPTGGLLPPSDVARAAALIASSNAWVLSDEVYSQIVYDGEVPVDRHRTWHGGPNDPG